MAFRPDLRKWGWVIPTLADLLLLFMVLRPYLGEDGWTELLSDASIGMHVRTGDLIRATGALPHSDPFSFASSGAQWFAWEWLTEVLVSALHSAAGVAGLGLAALALMLGTAALLLRNCVRRSGLSLVCVLISLAGFQTCLMHALARPHLITWIFLSLTVVAIELERQRPSWRLWTLIPLCVVWANLHGAFPVLPAYVGLTGVGLALERRWPEARRLVVCAVVAGVGTVLNPYELELHRHMVRFLTSPWATQMVQEFHPPSPSLGEQYWWFLAIGVGAAASIVSLAWRRQWADALVGLFFLGIATRSARHIPLLVIVAAPLIAGEAARLWRYASKEFRSLDRDLLPQLSRHSWLLPALLAGAFVFRGELGLPTDFPAKHFPGDLVTRHSEMLAAGRVLSTDAWGDYLIYRGYPRQRVFMDGLQDFFGPKLGEDYLEMMSAGPRTAALLEEWRFNVALVPRKKALSGWLKQQGQWRLVEETPLAALYVKSQ